MKWFKHYSDALDDPFIQELLDEFSHLGYVVWFGLIEIIAKENGTNVTGKVEISPSYLRRKLRTSPTTLRQVLEFCRSNDRLFVTFSEKKWFIEFPKILEIKDNYMKDLQASCKKPSNHKEEDKDKEKYKEEKEEDKDRAKVKIPKPVKKPKEKLESPLDIPPDKLTSKDFIAKYCESFKGLYGKNPVITGKDAGTATRLIQIPNILEIMERFFTSGDKFIIENCHSLSIVESQINKLSVNKKKIGGVEAWVAEKEAENATE